MTQLLDLSTTLKLIIFLCLVMCLYIIYQDYNITKKKKNTHNYLSLTQEIQLGYNKYKATSIMPPYIVRLENTKVFKILNILGLISFFIIIIIYKEYINISFPLSLLIKIFALVYLFFKSIWIFLKLYYEIHQIYQSGLIVRNSRVRYISTLTNTAAHGISLGKKIFGVLMGTLGLTGVSLSIDAAAEDFGMPKFHLARKLASPILDRVLSEDWLQIKNSNIVSSEEADVKRAWMKYLEAPNESIKKERLRYFIKVKMNSISEINNSYNSLVKKYPNVLLGNSVDDFIAHNNGEDIINKIIEQELYDNINRLNINNPLDVIKIESLYEEKKNAINLIHLQLESAHEVYISNTNKVNNLNSYNYGSDSTHIINEWKNSKEDYNFKLELNKLIGIEYNIISHKFLEVKKK
jgi:hypothetical protein